MPDYFVPLDTSYITAYHNSLLNRGILNLYVLNHVDRHRDALLKAFPDIDTFQENYQVNDNFLQDLIEYAEEEGVVLNEEEYGTSRERIRLLVKAFLARDLQQLDLTVDRRLLHRIRWRAVVAQPVWLADSESTAAVYGPSHGTNRWLEAAPDK